MKASVSKRFSGPLEGTSTTEGLTGEPVFAHDDAGARLTLSLDAPMTRG